MILDFARGSQAEPRGHALAYASSLTEPNAVYAAYLVVPPISIDLAKYMPPMFAEKISLADAESVSAIPLPPVPEKVESVDFVLRLAEARNDDVINLGALDTSNVHHMLSQVSQAAQAYLDLYTTFIKGLGATAEPPPAPTAIGESVEDVLASFMTEKEKLGEMSKLLGKVRYAIEGNDEALADEALAEVASMGARLTGVYAIDRLAAAVRIPGEKGRRLTDLHIRRCYSICDEDYQGVDVIDAEISGLE